MARESALWQRCRTGIKQLKACGHDTHFCRLENSAGEGNPDVDGCLNGVQLWLELKSCDRPARPTSMIRPKCRPAQDIWHMERTRAGCRTNYVLIQVGEARTAKLYLIPGHLYSKIKAPESVLAEMSILPDSGCTLAETLLIAAEGYTR